MDRRFVVGMLKDWGLALLIVAVLLGVWTVVRPSPPSSGPAPAFELPNLEQESMALQSLPEPIVVLNFWATWCGPCVAEIPELNAFHDANPEVGLYGISVDTVSTSGLKVHAKKLGMKYTILHDTASKVASAYGVDGIPVTFVVDQKREIRRVFVGSIDRKQLQEAVDAI